MLVLAFHRAAIRDQIVFCARVPGGNAGGFVRGVPTLVTHYLAAMQLASTVTDAWIR
jgi:hypothetical protein